MRTRDRDWDGTGCGPFALIQQGHRAISNPDALSTPTVPLTRGFAPTMGYQAIVVPSSKILGRDGYGRINKKENPAALIG